MQELSQLLGFIINSLNGSTVLVTADHGFMYQESALDESDKSTLDDKPAGTLKAKKRYLIGRSLGATSKAWSGNTKTTAGTSDDGSLDFWVPKGASRFHFTGGARFEDCDQVFFELGVGGDFFFRPPPGRRTRPAAGS